MHCLYRVHLLVHRFKYEIRHYRGYGYNQCHSRCHAFCMTCQVSIHKELSKPSSDDFRTAFRLRSTHRSQSIIIRRSRPQPNRPCAHLIYRQSVDHHRHSCQQSRVKQTKKHRKLRREMPTNDRIHRCGDLADLTLDLMPLR